MNINNWIQTYAMVLSTQATGAGIIVFVKMFLNIIPILQPFHVYLTRASVTLNSRRMYWGMLYSAMGSTTKYWYLAERSAGQY